MTAILLAGGVIGSLLLASAVLRLARRSRAWADRRMLVLAAMVAPAVLLGGILGGAVSMLLAGCPWFTLADQILIAILGAGFVALLTTVSARMIVQAIRARSQLEAISHPATDPALLGLLARLAAEVGVRVPALRIADTATPLAAAAGPTRPAVVLSTGLLTLLDDSEREAVIAHELAHLEQRDHVFGFLATWLRDGLWFIPTVGVAWRHFHQDREIACDILSAEHTGRPAALASALYKVWATEDARRPSLVRFGAGGADLERRLSHLLDRPPGASSRAVVGYGLLAGGAMAVVLALSPLWYVPMCMSVICKLAG